MSRVLGLLIVAIAVLWPSGGAAAASLPAADRRARKAALAMLQKAQTPEHRRLYRIVVPKEPSRLPSRYVVRYQANYIAWVAASRIVEVRRDETGARVEVLDPQGFARASLPVAEVDALTRLAFYLHGARSESRTGSIGLAGLSSVSHMPYRKLEFEGEGLSVVTIRAQPITKEIEGTKLDRFVLTALALRFEALLDEHVQPEHRVEPDLARIEQRLTEIPRGRGPLDTYDREDRSAIEARLLGNRLVAGRVAHAVPLLRRKGLDSMAYELSLATLPREDLVHALPGLLCSPDYAVNNPAHIFVSNQDGLPRTPILAALACEHTPAKSISLLSSLAAGTPEQGESLAVVRRRLAEDTEPEVRVAAARALWVLERDTAAHRLLREMARGPAGQRDRLDRLQVLALGALRPGAGEHEDEDARAQAELATQILRELSIDLRIERLLLMAVMRPIVTSGEKSRVVDLVPWLGHGDPAVVEATIDLIDTLDPQRATELARASVRRYAEGSGTTPYALAVEPYLPLLVRGDDRMVVESLHAATGPLRAEVRSPRHRRRRLHTAVLVYLEAGPAR